MPGTLKGQPQDRIAMEFALFCKTFRDDVDRLARLVDSAEAFNTEDLPFIITAPREDHRVIADHIGVGRTMLIADEDILRFRLERGGWYQQQVMKLAFGMSGLVDNYIILDSDHYVIRPFRKSDFLTENGTPYTIMSEYYHIAEHNHYIKRVFAELAAGMDVELRTTSPEILSAAKGPGVDAIRITPDMADPDAVPESTLWKTQAFMQRPGPGFCYYHGPIISTKALLALKETVLDRDGSDFETLIAIAPWEAYWYTEWVLSTRCIEVVPKAPMFVHFVTDESIIRAREIGLTNTALARSFMGVALAARHQELLSV